MKSRSLILYKYICDASGSNSSIADWHSFCYKPKNNSPESKPVNIYFLILLYSCGIHYCVSIDISLSTLVDVFLFGVSTLYSFHYDLLF